MGNGVSTRVLVVVVVSGTVVGLIYGFVDSHFLLVDSCRWNMCTGTGKRAAFTCMYRYTLEYGEVLRSLTTLSILIKLMGGISCSKTSPPFMQ